MLSASFQWSFLLFQSYCSDSLNPNYGPETQIAHLAQYPISMIHIHEALLRETYIWMLKWASAPLTNPCSAISIHRKQSPEQLEDVSRASVSCHSASWSSQTWTFFMSLCQEFLFSIQAVLIHSEHVGMTDWVCQIINILIAQKLPRALFRMNI